MTLTQIMKNSKDYEVDGFVFRAALNFELSNYACAPDGDVFRVSFFLLASNRHL